MKTPMLIVGLLAAGIAAYTKNQAPADVTIYVSGDRELSGTVEQLAKAATSQMYAKIGVRLAWRYGVPRASDKLASPVTVQLEFLREPPPGVSSNALACAKPFSAEGVAIWILYKRIHEMASTSAQEFMLLAHVMAHEISHVLQRTNTHSGEGIMKAHWTNHDRNDMETRRLEFTPLEADMIRAGLNTWKALP